MNFQSKVIAAIGVCFAAAGSVLGQATPPDVILRASTAPVVSGQWRVVADATAAGSFAMRHPDAGAAKLTAPLASPAN